jgi:hypothetical protein
MLLADAPLGTMCLVQSFKDSPTLTEKGLEPGMTLRVISRTFHGTMTVGLLTDGYPTFFLGERTAKKVDVELATR